MIKSEMTMLQLARKHENMRKILAINRRRHLVKEWHEKGSTPMEPSKDMIPNFSINAIGW